MPLQVRCKRCGFVIEERTINDFDKFDPYNLPKTCPNCGRKLDIKNMEVKIIPLLPLSYKNMKKREYRKVFRYVLSPNLPRSLYCEACGKRIKAGEKVVSVRRYGGKRKHYHEKCYNNLFSRF